MNHDLFLQQLLDTFSVYLVGKCSDQELGLGSDETLRVFIPDLHWMSRECLTRYTGGYSFNGKTLMGLLLPLLENTQVFQLGDRFDLWREATSDDENILTVYDRIKNDPDIKALSIELDNLTSHYCRGNHDTWLKQVEELRPTMKASQEKIVTGNDSKIQVD